MPRRLRKWLPLPLFLILLPVLTLFGGKDTRITVAPSADPPAEALFTPPAQPTTPPQGTGVIEGLWRSHASGVMVQAQGIVERLLPDDNDGSRHQRFILRLNSGHTVLIAHNIDVAPRINALQLGHLVTFQGKYEWNDKGGVVHWTHRDGRTGRPVGYLQHQGRTYQ